MKLTRFEDAWACAALGAIFPGSSEDGFADIGGMDVKGFLAGLMVSLPFKPALGLRAAIWLVALAPLFVVGRLTTLTRLRQADREQVIAKLLASPSYALRSLVMLLKTFGALLYAGDDRVRARLRPRRLSPSGPSAPRNVVPLRIKRAHVA
jgi:hypothetical protein